MLNTHSAIMDTVRTIFMVLDASIYFLLNIVYELFFNISTFNLIDREMVFSLVSRVQLIIGIFMLFQLVMIIMKGIVNPDSITDSKSGGAGNIIMRIVVSLGLLALIVPINIASPKNEYEKQVNNNGILFGTLYSLQHRILSNNTLGKIIIGDDSTNYTSSDPDGESLNTFSKKFITPIIKSFYQLNVDDDGKYVCNDKFDDEYKDEDPFVIIASGTKHCGKNYSMTMGYLMCTFIGLVLVILMFMITFEVAKRVFQLAVLQILAPIPIISYMDPKGSKDSAFSSWVKLLTSTYLDLFIHLGAVYFAIAIIRKFVETYFTEESVYGIIQTQKTGWVTGPLLLRWTFIVMCIGLLIFAKDAPKFIRQMLGIKSEKKFFDAFGQALGAGAVGAGIVSGAVSGAVSKYQNTSGDNKGKKVGAAILGAIGGGTSSAISSGKQFLNSKDGNFQGIMDNNRKMAVQNYVNAADDSTFGGRFLAGAQANLGVQNRLQQMDDMIKYYTSAKDAMGRINDAFNSNGDFKYKFRGKALKDAAGNIRRDATGQVIGDNLDIVDRKTGQIVLDHNKSYSLKDYNDILGRVQASGDNELIEAVDAAKKLAQAERLQHLRVTFTGANRTEARNKLIDKIKECAEAGNTDYTQRDLDVFDGAYSIYNVAQKYDNEPIFSKFKGKDFKDSSLSWAVFKTAASAAGDTGKSMKASPEYDQASSNYKRAQEAAKKK